MLSCQSSYLLRAVQERRVILDAIKLKEWESHEDPVKSCAPQKNERCQLRRYVIVLILDARNLSKLI